MLNSTHCSSSQELEDMSKLLRTMALIADTITATRISHARRFPVQRVNASIPRLSFKSDCNGVSSPNSASAVLTASVGRIGLSSRASMKQAHQTSGRARRQLEVC